MTEGIVLGADGRPRCWWAVGDPLYLPYHDDEWGRPVADDRRLFEKISLEGFMAGLSWLTILRTREHFREAFAAFDPAAVAAFGSDDVDRLVADPGIVRPRGKILATINNAQRYPDLVGEFGSLAAFVWGFEPAADARPTTLDYATLTASPTSPESKALSTALRRRGWAFVGPTTVQSTLESAGIVNHHLTGCHVRADVERERAAVARPVARVQHHRR